MPKPRHYSNRPRDDKRWRCYGCGAKHNLLAIRVERDEEFNRLRLRRCKNCGEVTATQETVISLDQFYARSTIRKKQGHADWIALKNQRAKKNWVPCPKCSGTYKIGHYSKHTLTPDHLATLKRDRSAHRREIERRSAVKAYWKKRGVDLDTATATHALEDLSGAGPDGIRGDRRVSRLADIREDIPA